VLATFLMLSLAELERQEMIVGSGASNRSALRMPPEMRTVVRARADEHYRWRGVALLSGASMPEGAKNLLLRWVKGEVRFAVFDPKQAERRRRTARM